jgi:hypothetical protein
MPIDFAYAQARAQARQAGRLAAARWRSAESSTDLNHYVHSLRGTVLAPVVQHFTRASSPHAIERALRRAWRTEVERASEWVPPPWRNSVAWTTWLPDLDTIRFLLDGGAALPWMLKDKLLGPFALDEKDARRIAIEAHLGRLPPAAEFVPAEWWIGRWREQLPTTALAGTGLDELVSLLRSFSSDGWGQESPSAGAYDSMELLSAGIVRLLHRRAATPVSVYCHLALTAIELMRLRGGLVQRTLANAGEFRRPA